MYKKIFALVLLLTLIVGCMPEKPAETASEITAPTSTVKVETAEPTPVETAKPATPGTTSSGLSSDIRTLLAKGDDVESLKYGYTYFEAESRKTYVAEVSLRDNKMKQYLGTPIWNSEKKKEYDTVYLDLQAKTAMGFCENADRCEEESMGVPIELSYSSFKVETPYDVIKMLNSNAKIQEKARFDNKDSQVITMKNNEGNEQKFWIWEYKGIPLKYEIYDDSSNVLIRVEYKSMVTDQVKSSDVTYSS